MNPHRISDKMNIKVHRKDKAMSIYASGAASEKRNGSREAPFHYIDGAVELARQQTWCPRVRK